MEGILLSQKPTTCTFVQKFDFMITPPLASLLGLLFEGAKRRHIITSPFYDIA